MHTYKRESYRKKSHWWAYKVTHVFFGCIICVWAQLYALQSGWPDWVLFWPIVFFWKPNAMFWNDEIAQIMATFWATFSSPKNISIFKTLFQAAILRFQKWPNANVYEFLNWDLMSIFGIFGYFLQALGDFLLWSHYSQYTGTICPRRE